MDSQNPQPKPEEIHAFFLKQGQSIKKVHEMLDSNIFSHYVGNVVSFIFEYLLYIVCLVVFMIVLCFPDGSINWQQQMNDSVSLSEHVEVKELMNFIFIIKVVILLLTIPLFLFARLIRKNRKKNTLIRAAFEETENMKRNFEEAMVKMKW